MVHHFYFLDHADISAIVSRLSCCGNEISQRGTRKDKRTVCGRRSYAVGFARSHIIVGLPQSRWEHHEQ